MKVEVLVSTMHQKNTNLIDKMNLKTDAIIINQTDCDDFKEVNINNRCIKIFSLNERGVAKSRNTALKHATADICLLADDDMFFDDNYEETAKKVFTENNDADVIIFNLIEDEDDLNRINSSVTKVGIFNYMNYGAARIAFKNKSIKDKNISFKVNADDSHPTTCGEDTLFLRDCLKKGLKIIAVPEAIAKLNNERKSTWFKGYNKQYFFDKGVVLALAHPVLAFPFAFYLTLKHNEYLESGFNKSKIFKEISKGIIFIKRKNYKKSE